jgi:nicotinamidase/pyrazinamidase
MSDSLVPGPSDALVVIDVQNDFCPGGTLPVADGHAVVPVINRLMPMFQTVVLTQDWHPPGHASFASAHAGVEPFASVEMPYGQQVLWPDHCVKGTAGAEFHKDLDTAHAAVVIRKGLNPAVDSYSAFFENDRRTPTGLSGWLRDKGIGRVFCAGLATDFCVAYSVLDARALGLEAVLVEDACRGIDLNNSVAAALSDMAAAGATTVAAPTLRRDGRA